IRQPVAQAVVVLLLALDLPLVDRLKLRKQSLAEHIDKWKVESKKQNNDSLSYRLADQDLGRLQHMQALIKEKLKQLDFEIGQDKFRVTLVDRAREPRIA